MPKNYDTTSRNQFSVRSYEETSRARRRRFGAMRRYLVIIRFVTVPLLLRAVGLLSPGRSAVGERSASPPGLGVVIVAFYSSMWRQIM